MCDALSGRIRGWLCYSLTPGHASPQRQQPRRTLQHQHGPSLPQVKTLDPPGRLSVHQQPAPAGGCLLLTGHAHTTTTTNLTGYHTVLLCALANAGRRRTTANNSLGATSHSHQAATVQRKGRQKSRRQKPLTHQHPKLPLSHHHPLSTAPPSHHSHWSAATHDARCCWCCAQARRPWCSDSTAAAGVVHVSAPHSRCA